MNLIKIWDKIETGYVTTFVLRQVRSRFYKKNARSRFIFMVVLLHMHIEITFWVDFLCKKESVLDGAMNYKKSNKLNKTLYLTLLVKFLWLSSI